MPKEENKFGSEVQGSLFWTEDDPLPGSFDLGSTVRSVLADTIRRSTLSREQIADRMSELTASSITVRMLNDFTADSKQMHRFPLAWTAAFCQVTGDFRLIDAILRRLGVRIVTERQYGLLTFAEQFIQHKQNERKITVLEEQLVAAAGGSR